VNALHFVAYVLAGLAVGGAVGYVLGRRTEGDRRGFWLAAAGLIAACVVADYFGVVLALEWLRTGAVCAMAGALTGLKYGGMPEVRVWESPPRPPAAESDDTPPPRDADAS